jgi:hypothetical protein
VSTGLYVLLWQVEAPLWQWAVVSLVIGLGFTFFSGAVEAWLVDALDATGFEGPLESVFARGQVIGGVAMLAGSVGGGYLAQATSLGAPFVLRAAILALMFVVAFALMRDIGFTPRRDGRPWEEIKVITASSIEYGWRVPAVRFVMLAGLFTGGVGVYVFYALQPYLLELYGDPEAYGIAGLVAAIVAGSQILGGLVTAQVRRLFRRHLGAAGGRGGGHGRARPDRADRELRARDRADRAVGADVRRRLPDPSGLHQRADPVRAARHDPLVRLAGGLERGCGRPLVLGRAADVWGYPASYLMSGALSALALPFIARARMERAAADLASAGA